MSIKRFYLTITIPLILFCTSKCLAQELKLNDIKRFELLENGGGPSGDTRVLEIVTQNNRWICLQTQMRTMFGEDTTRKFVKYIPKLQLTDLVKIVNRKDTAIHLNLFKIKKAELISYVDSITPALNSKIRIKLIKALKSKSIVCAALRKELVPFKMDDKSFYSITITTKTNLKIIFEAHSFADLYNLPWYTGGYKSYNPNISLIFESIAGHDNFPLQQRKWLNKRVTKSIYRSHFK